MTPEAVERYARHLVLKELGGPGQQALMGAKVGLVGAGGLGGPAGIYLAAAGVGHITIIDNDTVEASNLQRQVQFTPDDIGHDKATVMAKALRAQNPLITVTALTQRVTPDNAASLLQGHDVILDGVDNFNTRFAVNAASLALGIPLISGALGRWEGQLGLFPADGVGPCYQCLVPDAPPNAQSCAEVGLIGALAGIIGTLMALETTKLITGAGDSLSGKIRIFDGLSLTARTLTLPRDPACAACGQAN